MGTKKDGDMCYDAALPDEPMFVLLARDTYAPTLVEAWANNRARMIQNGNAPATDNAKVEEALAWIDKAAIWRSENYGGWRKDFGGRDYPTAVPLDEPQPDIGRGLAI